MRQTLAGILHDVRSGLRVLREQRNLTIVSVIILAVCIGANTAIYSVLQRIVLRPFPGVERQDRLVAIGTWDGSEERCCGLSYPDLEDVRLRARNLEGILGAKLIGVNIGTAERPSFAGGQLVTSNFFVVSRVRPLLGRTFVAGEDRVGAAPVAVISERLWRDRFDSNRGIVGSAQLLNGRPFTIVGIVPETFRGLFMGYWIDVWAPLSTSHLFIAQGARHDDRRDPWLSGYGRLKDGVTVEQANAEIRAIMRQLAVEHPSTNAQRHGAAFALSRSPYGATPFLTPALAVLMVVVTLVLLIGCANIAGLQLVRALARLRELAIRSALGASAARLFRQLLIENLLLAAAGGIGGLAIAYSLRDVLGVFLPPRRVRVDLSGEIDARALLMTAGLSLVCGVICGLVPAMQAWKLDLAGTLKEEPAGASTGRTRLRMREALVVAQVCLCVILCVTAGLFVQQTRALQQLDPGFARRGLLFASYNFFASGYDSGRGSALMPEILSRLRATPGVISATSTSRVPLSLGEPENSEIRVDGYTAAPKEKPSAGFSVVGPDYFRTMETRILAGRDLDERDTPNAPLVCAVNDALRAKYFPNRDPIGSRIFLAGQWRTIVAVVANGKYQRLSDRPRAFAFLPMQQNDRGDGMIVVRTNGSPAGLAQPVRRVLAELAPRLTPFVTTIDDHMSIAAFPERLAATLIGALGVCALLLAMIGVYAVISYGVSRRARELAIRMAIGATSPNVRRLVVRRGAAIASVGIVLGSAAAFACATALRNQLTALSGFDIVPYGFAVTLIGSAALLASWIPALRAGRIEPAEALRR